MSAHHVKVFPQNTQGRDFVMGDIHGAYDSVLQRMKDVAFNKKIDRLYVAGDLIDRGPQSKRVKAFLEQPYVHSVLGNHEFDFLSLSPEDLQILAECKWDKDRFFWVRNCSDSEILEIQKLFETLPIVIEVQTVRGVVGIVHADVPKGMDWNTFKRQIIENDKNTIYTALYSRGRLKRNDHSGVIGIDRLFVGHSIQWDGPKRLGNVYHVDSGAIFREIGENRGFLTMANIACHSQVLTPQDRKTGPKNVGLYPGSKVTSFGQYAEETFDDLPK